jgi:hypothetical protein
MGATVGTRPFGTGVGCDALLDEPTIDLPRPWRLPKGSRPRRL